MPNPAISAPSPDADTKLIDLCAKLTASGAQLGVLNRCHGPDDRLDEVLSRRRKLVGRIIATPALTEDGVRAKATAFRDVMKINLLGGPGLTMANSTEVEEGDRLGWSLLHNVLGEDHPGTNSTAQHAQCRPKPVVGYPPAASYATSRTQD